MKHKRDLMRGMTDYTGVSIEDILSDIEGWELSTSETIDILEKNIAEIESKKDFVKKPQEVLSLVSFFIHLFTRYKNDFHRLTEEIPSGVTESHIEIIKQILQSAELEEKRIIDFNIHYILKEIIYDDMRPIFDEVYKTIKDLIIDYDDLSNLGNRLKTFISTSQISGQKMSSVTANGNVSQTNYFYGNGYIMATENNSINKTKQEIDSVNITGSINQKSDVQNTQQNIKNATGSNLNQILNTEKQSLSWGKYSANGLWAVIVLAILIGIVIFAFQ